ncbi:MAG: LysR family transcriptional regulator [Alphaproteobacteria bacterium]|nr:LysR family transcriptional regulator [Alphaproteobacteria bacterium]
MAQSFRDIRMFVAAYEERSFTAAAARENATQSGVSQHIRKLEERFGVRLFARTGGSVVPTPAGDVYYRNCLEVLRAYNATNEALRPYAGTIDGEVMIGLMPTMTRCALAPALERFVALHPNVAIHVVEAFSGVLIEQVRAGALAFAVVPAFAGGAGLRQGLFARTREVLVSRAGVGRTHLAPVRLSSLAALKLVLPRPQNSRRSTVETYVTSNGARIERVIELDAMMGTLDFVARTDWVTVLPGLMMASDVDPARFTVNPLDEPPLWLDLVQIESSHQSLTPAAQAFCQILAQETHRLNRPWSEDVPR